MALTDYSIDTSGTDKEMQRRQTLAEALMQKGMDTSPAAGGKNGAWLTALNRGLAGALGGYQRGQEQQTALANRQSGQAVSDAYVKSLLGNSAGSVPASLAAQPPTADAAASGIAQDATKIYSQDQLNPMDEPRGNDRTKMIATLLGEEKPGSPESLGAANVIRNRAVDGGYGGDTPDAVVQSPSQFSPWNDQAGRARMARALQDPSQVAKANDTIDQTYGVGKYASAGPNDPTEGKTHFYDPASMVPPNSVPKWAQGKEGQQIGKTLFFDDPNEPTPPNAQMAQGQLPNQQQVMSAAGQSDVNAQRRAALAAALDPNVPATTRAIAKSDYDRLSKPEPIQSIGGGYIVQNGVVKRAYQPEDKTPASVQEYEYAKKNSPPGSPFMSYSEWSDKKSRAAATSVTTNVDTKGPDKYDTVMSEGMAKAHGALANGVEDAQARARDLAAMQGAIDAIQKNGGTTGGMGQAQVLELKKTINAGASGLGITTPFDEKDISDKEFMTKFNRQIAGQQAKGAVGSRVTNFEMSNYLKANPGLEMSVTGNQRLIGIQSQIEQRNVAVGNAIREATAEAVGSGQKINPMKVQKIIKDYDEEHHVKDPVTGQDLTQSYTLPEFQKKEQGTNAGLAAGHETNMKKIRKYNPATGELE